jgi:hypothetical protein
LFGVLRECQDGIIQSVYKITGKNPADGESLMSLCVAVLKERAEGERRVALDPVNANKLAGRGLRILVQSGAGNAAGFSDAQYSGAEIVSNEEAALA